MDFEIGLEAHELRVDHNKGQASLQAAHFTDWRDRQCVTYLVV